MPIGHVRWMLRLTFRDFGVPSRAPKCTQVHWTVMFFTFPALVFEIQKCSCGGLLPQYHSFDVKQRENPLDIRVFRTLAWGLPKRRRTNWRMLHFRCYYPESAITAS